MLKTCARAGVSAAVTAAILAIAGALTHAYQTSVFQWILGPAMPATMVWDLAAFPLPGGQIVAVGRRNDNPNLADPYYIHTVRVFLFDPSTQSWRVGADGSSLDDSFSSIQLADGRILVGGGAPNGALVTEVNRAGLYDASSNTWADAGLMLEPRLSPTLVRLQDGRVLALGGSRYVAAFGLLGQTIYVPQADGTVEIYDPSKPYVQFTAPNWVATGSMSTARLNGAALTLGDGRVLAVGGQYCSANCDPTVPSSPPTMTAQASAELYDPSTGRWTPTGSMQISRSAFLMQMLPDGRVLVAGGNTSTYDPALNSFNTRTAEIYDPATGRWTLTGSMNVSRIGANMVITRDGKALVTGGDFTTVPFAPAITQMTSEAFDPATGAWTMQGNLAYALRNFHVCVIAADGRPMLIGGLNTASMEFATQPVASCSGGITPATRTIASGAAYGTLAITISSGCRWAASSDASWLKITSAASSGTTNATLSYWAAANPSITNPRTAHVTVNGDQFTVTELAQPCTASSSPAAPTLAAPGGQFTLNITTPTGCTWTATPNVSWIHGPVFQDSISAMFNADPNPSPTQFRQGTISIGYTVITVTQAPTNSAAPFGTVDTPLDNATGVSGSIAVTGWALDDLQVTRVRILRNTVSPEPAGQTVYIGDANFVTGARPDIAATYPTYPFNTSAGWGYLLLTNFLPNKGNGTFTLYAYADDREGHSTLLGTRTITCTNSTATAPFGAIDTPGQGDTVSGTITNYGWVLSQGPARADPPSGGRVTVLIDGLPVGSPTGWTSRADLVSLFPSTQFPGVVDALGVYSVDTTQLADGVHTIAWAVTDNTGIGAGIGSRYFTVANGAAFRLKPEATRLDMWLPPSGGSTVSGGRAIWGRTGFDLDAPLRAYLPGPDGIVVVNATELDRIELQVDASRGYVRTSTGPASLPFGATLKNGAFTWMPGVAYVGPYDFVFDDLKVRIVLRPR